jgi:hypothetical protein
MDVVLHATLLLQNADPLDGKQRQLMHVSGLGISSVSGPESCRRKAQSMRSQRLVVSHVPLNQGLIFQLCIERARIYHFT